MVTIAASRVWALNTQRRLLWTSHAPIAGGWPSRGCGPGFVSCKGAGYPCLCRDLGFPLVATGGRLLPAVAGLVLRWQWGIPLKQRGLLLLPALRYRWSCLGNGLAPPMEGGYRLYPLALPPMIGCRSLHWRVSQTNPEMMVQWFKSRWSDRLRCNCVQGPLLPGAVIRCSPPGPVGTRRPWPAVPMRPAEKLLQPYTLWRCCRFTRPRHWGTCTRVVTTQEFSVSFGPPRTSRYERRRLRRGLWAVQCPPWWSRNATSGCVWLTWRRQTRHGSWMPPSPRPACSATRWRTSPSSSPLHRSRLRQSGTSCPGVQLLPPPGRRRQCLGLLVAEGGSLPPPPAPTQQPPAKQRRGAGRAPAKPGGKRRSKRPWDGRPRDGDVCSSGDGERTTPSPGGGPGGESFVSFSATGLTVSGTQNLDKRAVSSISGSPEGTGGCERVKLELHSPSSLASGQLWAVREGGQSHYSRTLCQNAGKCVTHADPASDRQRDARAGSLRSPSLPHRRYVSGFVGVTSTVLGGLASAPQPVSLAPPYHQTRLCDSVRPATSQVSRHPLHHSEGSGCPHLASRDLSSTGEGRDRAGPSSRYEVGVLQPLLHCTQEKRWVKTNLGSARFEPGPSQAPVQNAHTETHLWVRPSPRLVCSDRPEGRVLPCVDPSAPQAIPAVCVRRTAYQYKVLPFGLSLSPRVFTKVAEAALVPLREQGVRILNYLDDWLILAQSQDQLCEHRDMVLSHLSQLGLQVNWEKSKLSPVQRISFLGMELDSVSQTARLTQERAQSVLNCLNTFKNRTAAPLKQFQRLLGHMAAAAAVTPLGLLHMRPLQHWLHGRVPRWAWQSGTLRVQVTPACRQTFTPWSDLSFLRAGVPLEQVSRHAVVYTDASAKGWGATFNGHAVSGVWTGPQLHWHINCLELLAVHLALNRLKRRLRGEHVLVRTDNTATVAYINRQGGLRSRRMSQLARHLLLWSRKHLRSLRAIHIPGLLNRTADELSRAALPGEWRLHPQTVQLIWRRFGLAQVDLFASLETSHCQLFYSLTDGTLGTDALAHSWPRGLRKYAFPPVSLLAQTLCKVREEEEQILLVAPYWPTRTWFPELMLLVTAPPWQIPLRKDLLTQRRGTLWHPRPDLWKLHVWSLDGTRRF